jgi:nucleotide-binding universal stress UspA family protein
MTDLRTVAVGFDGSPDSTVALHWAAALCEQIGATLRVIHVVGLLEERHLTAHAPVTADLAVQIATETGLSADRVEWDPRSGSPSDALVQATKPPHSVDLLVVGTRGAGRRPELLLGSTSLEVAQHASIPVVVVPKAD